MTRIAWTREGVKMTKFSKGILILKCIMYYFLYKMKIHVKLAMYQVTLCHDKVLILDPEILSLNLVHVISRIDSSPLPMLKYPTHRNWITNMMHGHSLQVNVSRFRHFKRFRHFRILSDTLNFLL